MSQAKSANTWVEIGLSEIDPATIAQVQVPGNPKAKSREEDPEMVSWIRHVVLEPELLPSQPYKIGFISVFKPELLCYLDQALTDRFFRMRIGPEMFEAVVFQAFPDSALKINSLALHIAGYASQGGKAWQHISLY